MGRVCVCVEEGDVHGSAGFSFFCFIIRETCQGCTKKRAALLLQRSSAKARRRRRKAVVEGCGVKASVRQAGEDEM